jgi:hypothetical protein
MQPDDQRPDQVPQEQPEQVGGPVVTLSPDENTVVEAAPQDEVQGDEQRTTDRPATPIEEPIHWQASEYVHREKDHIWLVLFILFTIALTCVAVFLIKSLSFAVLVPIMAVALFIYTHRPPRMLDYTLSRQGLHINDKLFPFSEFKSFAILHGLDQYSIMLIPTKRFQPAITINFPEEVGEAIVDMLAPRLPMREVQPDIVDRIIRKLHL